MLELCTAVSHVTLVVTDPVVDLATDCPFRSQIDNATDLDGQLDGILATQMENHPHQLLHTVAFY